MDQPTIGKEKFQYSLSTSYTGEVITTYGDPYNQTLDSYMLTDFSVRYIFDLTHVSIEAKIKNLMNKSYVTYQNYPNPGTEYLLTLNYTIN